MEWWTIIRLLHVLGLAFFVGGQIMLVATIVPVARRWGDDELMRAVGRRFGIGSAVALAIVIATGIAMAEHFGRWEDSTLQVKLMLLVLVGVLMAFHAITPTSRVLSLAVFVTSLAIVWLGVELSHGF